MLPTFSTPPRPGQTPVQPLKQDAQGDLTIPGYTPDYRALLLSDPEYVAANAQAQNTIAGAGAQRQAALRSLVEGYGGIGGVTDTYGDINASTRGIAGSNQFSTRSQIARNYSQGVAALKRALAARHMLHSSDLSGGLEQADNARGAAEYDAGQQFSNAFNSIVNGYLGTLGQANQSTNQALGNAATRLQTDPRSQPGQATQAHLVPDWQTKYGVPVYDDGSGGIWRVGPDGTPVPIGSAPTYTGPDGQPVTPTTYAQLGITPDAIGPQPLQGPISSDMVQAPVTNPVQYALQRGRAQRLGF